MADAVPPEDFRTLRDTVAQKAAKNGNGTFLNYLNRTISYREFDQYANAIANEFRARGVEPGDHVCLFMYNSPEYVFTVFALAKIGAVSVPIDTRFTDETLQYVLTHSDAETICIDADTQPEYERVRSAVPNISAEYFLNKHVDEHGYRNFEQLLGGNRTATPEGNVSPSDPLTVIYVQRSAAERPKGVVIPHFAYINTGWEAAKNLFEFSGDDRIFTTLPLYSSFTFQVGVMGALLADAEFVLKEQFNPSRFWSQISNHDATVFLYLSRMLSVLQHQDVTPDEADTPAELAIGHSFGFATDEELFHDFEDRFGVTILEGYGVTPATIATYNRPGDRKLGSVGTEASYVDLEIVDDNDWPVPAGETGEIVVRPTRPHTMMKEYYENPTATHETFQNQWLHTGGIGYRDEDGYVHFIANRDNSIYRGRIDGRISSLEIESVINEHPGIRLSTVVGIQNQRGNENIKAVVIPEDDAEITPVDICRQCEQQLPYLKVPRYIELREDLPRSPSGKIRKRDLKDEGTADVWDRKSGYELSR